MASSRITSLPLAVGVLMLMLTGIRATALSAEAEEANAQTMTRSSLLSATGAACGGTDMVERLIPCLPAARTNPAPPSRECCELIHGFSADCLCTCLQSPLAKLEGVNFGIALGLPHKCKRPVPPGTKCAGVYVPGWTP